MSTATERTRLVDQTLAQIKSVAATQGITRSSLETMAGFLNTLAQRADLFDTDAFPAPPPEAYGTSTLNLLRKEPDDSYALYLNQVSPGRNTVPHNHTTWAIIVAIEGDEHNRIYRRLDDGSREGYAEIVLDREVVVAPGKPPVCLLPDDIHSIHVDGDRSTRHFHLYGLAMNRLDDRLAFNIAERRAYPYNQQHYNKPKNAD